LAVQENNMSDAPEDAIGIDFALGAPLSGVPDGGVLAGRVGDRSALAFRDGRRITIVSATCTHYGAPLSQGLSGDGVVRCPWHHACFDLRTGTALRAPAFDPLDTWRVEIAGDRFFAREQQSRHSARPSRRPGDPNKIVIVGGGAAGFAAAEMLRRLGYAGALTMLSADAAPPCDRPNLSKDYLAGTAPEEWIPLKGNDFYAQHAIELRLGADVTAIDLEKRQVTTASGERHGFDALLLATGAEPVRLSAPGFDRQNVYTLRTLADARAIIAAAERAKTVAVIGASFIGLEVAASLRARGLDVHVVAPDAVPMERVLGREIGAFVHSQHEAHGVRFHLKQTAEGFDGRRLELSNGGSLEADFVVLGVGVRPRTDLAVAAGLAVDNGVIVDRYFETSAKGVFAAGDVARYPDPRTGKLIRVEHWVAAERQGQAVAANLLGAQAPFSGVPFFWSNHYGHAIRYVGHAPDWDAVDVDGSAASGNCSFFYYSGRCLLAACSIGRDLESLKVERMIERDSEGAVAALPQRTAGQEGVTADQS
jgi:NADPH-dependent 2,4-dienoyl-CoA reductase/sulfur reductase-like enzyme/nitrite reductase/ring-hydroxylating ferredoxin subunit